MNIRDRYKSKFNYFDVLTLVIVIKNVLTVTDRNPTQTGSGKCGDVSPWGFHGEQVTLGTQGEKLQAGLPGPRDCPSPAARPCGASPPPHGTQGHPFLIHSWSKDLLPVLFQGRPRDAPPAVGSGLSPFPGDWALCLLNGSGLHGWGLALASLPPVSRWR